MIQARSSFFHLATLGLWGASAACLLAQSGAEDLRLTVGKSVVIDYPSDVRQISTSNPDVVDANPVTTREILVQGKGLGSATMVVWNKAGQRTFYNINVELNLEPLRKLMRDTFPNEDIHVQSSRDAISLTGRVSSQPISERAALLVAPFGKSVINNLGVNFLVDRQIMIRVKFAQLDRSVTSQYGVNFISTGAGNTIGRTTTGGFPAPAPTTLQNPNAGGGASNSTFNITDALNIFAFRPDLNLGAFVKLLQSQSLLEILAEPNIVATNGKEAQFLVGGEFPVPVIQGGASAGAITIQFREFGIKLVFTPFITENKTIKMHLKQEVSTIDLSNAVVFNGFTIPALSTRRAETDVELAEGQSFAVAGLIDNRETDSYTRIPGLASLPILGVLFKTKSEARSRSELVVIVTPEITQPLNPGDPQPLPYMPKDFLVPILPPKPGSPLDPAMAKPAPARNPLKWLMRSRDQ